MKGPNSWLKALFVGTALSLLIGTSSSKASASIPPPPPHGPLSADKEIRVVTAWELAGNDLKERAVQDVFVASYRTAEIVIAGFKDIEKDEDSHFKYDYIVNKDGTFSINPNVEEEPSDELDGEAAPIVIEATPTGVSCNLPDRTITDADEILNLIIERGKETGKISEKYQRKVSNVKIDNSPPPPGQNLQQRPDSPEEEEDDYLTRKGSAPRIRAALKPGSAPPAIYNKGKGSDKDPA